MKQELEFKLERPAKKKGGDRYECKQDEDFKIYFPQGISRPNGVPLGSLKVTVEGD